jgi:carbamoyltransferase
MIVLGIADNHDSGAAVVVNDRLISAVNQERLDRVKNSGAFPWSAIDAALDAAGVKAREVDRIVVGTGFTPSAVLRAFPEKHQEAKGEGQFSPLLHAYTVYQSALRASGMHALEVDACRGLLSRKLKERRFDGAKVVMMDHHEAHAHGAYRTQGREHCLVLTVDAMGDGTTATAWLGQDGQLDQLFRQGGLATVNSFYSRVTEVLGFTPNRHEGKITGLAAYVTPPPGLLAHMRRRLAFAAPGFTTVSRFRVERKDDAFWSEVARWSREEVAACAQAVLEESVTAYVAHWLAQTGCGHVAVAGGVFANVKLNQRIAELPGLDSLWVMPHMGDGGLAAGAALGSVEAAPTTLPSACLGLEFSDRDCHKALDRGGHRAAPRRDGGDIERVAELLAAGKVVASCQGRMEWGPRALGHRTVFVRADDPAVNDWLNAKLKRSEFMPFAPIVRAEDVDRWFVGASKAPEAARFMTVCFDCTDAFKAAAPGVVHVDGTARPQVVHKEHSPRLHALLTAYGERTGAAVLVNTSFNLHEEPIVCTPSDAVRAFEQAELDALWIGPYVTERKGNA